MSEVQNEFIDQMGRADSGVRDVVLTIGKKVETGFYTSSGVNVEKGDDFSAVAGKISKGSYENSPLATVGDLSRGSFRGPRGFDVIDGKVPPNSLHTLAPDGIGTKVILIDTIGSHLYAAMDVVAMTGDDIARFGGVPVVFTNVLDVSSITDENEDQFKNMMVGLGEVAKSQRFIILNGETAELGACVGSPNIEAKTKFNWSGMMHGLYNKDKMITGENMQPGDVLVAFRQPGFRSNGISGVREAFRLKYGDDWYTKAPKEEIIEAASPSVPYARIIAEANGWYNSENNFEPLVDMTAIANLSGGSFQGKVLEDMLAPTGHSAKFTNLFPISAITQKCAIWSAGGKKPIRSIDELYSTWCCEQGMIIALPNEEEAQKLIALCGEDVEGRICGKVTETPESEKPSLTISNIKLEDIIA